MTLIFAPPFRIQRKTLIAGEMTEVVAPRTCSSCTVANWTGDDIQIITDGTGTEYGVLSDGFEERINLSQSGSATALFHANQISFYLKAAQTGVVVIAWT